MSKLTQKFVAAFLLGTVFFTYLFIQVGVIKPAVEWKYIDIIGELGIVVFTLIWATLILGSRPRGRISTLLAVGLCVFALGSWLDFLDEFIRVEKSSIWDNYLESGLTLGGMLIFSVGLYLLREEQLFLNDHMLKRERIFREHRSFDRLTQIGNADYLRRQIQHEKSCAPDAPCVLLMVELEDFHQISRQHGFAEGDRVLQAITQLLLLNLRNSDLLCRYAGNRFAILMPRTDKYQAFQFAALLERNITQLAYHTHKTNERLSMNTRSAFALCGEKDVESLLSDLNVELEESASSSVAQHQFWNRL